MLSYANALVEETVGYLRPNGSSRRRTADSDIRSPRGRPGARLAPRAALASLRAIVSLSAIAAVGACAGSPTSNETAANGDAPRVESLSISHGGGHEVRQRVVVDSATHHFTVSRCDDAPLVTACTNLRLIYEGTTPEATLGSLFRATNTPAFRALNPNYPSPPGVVSPDGGSSRLEVVRNGSRRVITWTNDAYLPQALVNVNCILLEAQLSKILCD